MTTEIAESDAVVGQAPYRVTEVKRSGEADAGLFLVTVEGQRPSAGADAEPRPDRLVYCFWYRIGAAQVRVWWKSAYDARLMWEVSKYESRGLRLRGLGLAEAAARDAFATHRAGLPPRTHSDYEKRQAARRSEARASKEIAEAAHEFLRQMADDGRSCSVSLMTGYVRQHSAGAGAFEWLSRREQADIVRSVLERLVREGRAERCFGSSERGRRECAHYLARSSVT